MLSLLACAAPVVVIVPPDDTAVASTLSSDSGPPVVVIIGAGPAGLAAAQDLPGAILLEGSDTVGGRAPGSEQLMLFVGTEEQDAAFADDSVELALEEWATLTGAAPTAATEAFLRDSDAVHDRLAALGLPFTLGMPDFLLRRVRLHAAGHPGLGGVLGDALPSDVDLRVNTWVTGLVIEDGAVRGVETADGRIDADVVLIASGGFANRKDLVGRYVGWEMGRWNIGDDSGAQGAAVDWAEAEGLGLASMEAMGAMGDIIGLPGADGYATANGRMGDPPWIWVDSKGERFVDETEVYSLALVGMARARAPVWGLAPYEKLVKQIPAEETGVLAAFTCGESWEEVALAIDVDPAGLAATLSGPDKTGRGKLPSMSGTPCAFPPGMLSSKGFGGIAVDERHRVLDTEGRPIVGLYAAGEAAGMGVPGMGGAWGFDGSLSAVVWSGWATAASILADLE